MKVEDAEALLIRWLRNPPTTSYSSYGYDLYLPTVLREHLRAAQQPSPWPNEERGLRTGDLRGRTEHLSLPSMGDGPEGRAPAFPDA